MSNAMMITRIHLSLIWSEMIPELLSMPRRDLPMGWLGQRQRYADQFESALARSDQYEPPWTPQTRANRNHFWYYYLGKRFPDELSGDEAWQMLVPLRTDLQVQARLSDEWGGGRIFDTLFYPHGIAFICTLILQPRRSLAETVDWIVEARRARVFQTKWEGKPPRRMSLDEFAQAAMNDLRRRVIGTTSMRRVPMADPFTIVTIVKGEMERTQPPSPLENRGEIHQALHGLCSFSPTWREEKRGLPDLKDCSASVKLMPDDHVVYGFERHRVVWFPAYMTKPLPRHHTLSCYHRNLVFLSLQTEMLGKLIQSFAAQLEAGELASPAHLNLVEHGASILSRLRGGVADTYQSWSARMQIEPSDVMSALARTRQYLGWEAPQSSG